MVSTYERFALPGNFDATEPIFGVAWDKGEDPTLSRTDSSVGMIAQAGVDGQVVQNDFDSAPIFGEMREVTDPLGNVFVRIPKFYIEKVDSENFKSWRVSRAKRPGFYLPACFYDFANGGRELPYVDVGKYNASLDASGRLESKPGKHPLVNKNIVDFRDYAKANNTDGLRGYQLMDIHVVDLLQTLFYIEFATLNSQSIMTGFVNGAYSATHAAVIAESGTNRVVLSNANAAAYRVGQSLGIGSSLGGQQVASNRVITAIQDYDADNKSIVFDGTPVNIAVGNIVYNTGAVSGLCDSVAASSGSPVSRTDGKWPAMYRGVENPWGNIWQFVDGVNISDWQAWVCRDAEQYVSNVFAAPYEQLSYRNHDVSGYPMSMGHDPEHPYAEFPTAIQTTGVSSAKYYGDYYYHSAGQRIALVGDYWRNGTSAGPSSWNLQDSSGSTRVSVGGRLVRKAL